MFNDVVKCYERMEDLIDLSFKGFGTEDGVLDVLLSEGYSEDIIAEVIELAQIVETLRKTGTYSMNISDSLYSTENVEFICEQFEEGNYHEDYDNDEIILFTSCDDYNEYYCEWLYNKAYAFYKDIVDDLWLDMNAVNKFWYLHKFFSLVRKNKFDFADASTKEQHMYLAYNYVFGRTTILPDEAVHYVHEIYEYLYNDNIEKDILLFEANISGDGKDVDECIDSFIDSCIDNYGYCGYFKLYI